MAVRPFRARPPDCRGAAACLQAFGGFHTLLDEDVGFLLQLLKRLVQGFDFVQGGLEEAGDDRFVVEAEIGVGLDVNQVFQILFRDGGDLFFKRRVPGDILLQGFEHRHAPAALGPDFRRLAREIPFEHPERLVRMLGLAVDDAAGGEGGGGGFFAALRVEGGNHDHVVQIVLDVGVLLEDRAFPEAPQLHGDFLVRENAHAGDVHEGGGDLHLHFGVHPDLDRRLDLWIRPAGVGEIVAPQAEIQGGQVIEEHAVVENLIGHQGVEEAELGDAAAAVLLVQLARQFERLLEGHGLGGAGHRDAGFLEHRFVDEHGQVVAPVLGKPVEGAFADVFAVEAVGVADVLHVVGADEAAFGKVVVEIRRCP